MTLNLPANDELSALEMVRGHVEGQGLGTDGPMLLFAAAARGYARVVRYLATFHDCIDVNWHNPAEGGNTALHAAAMAAHGDVVEALLSFPGIRHWAVNNRQQQAVDCVPIVSSTHQSCEQQRLRCVNLLSQNEAVGGLTESSECCPDARQAWVSGSTSSMTWVWRNGSDEPTPFAADVVDAIESRFLDSSAPRTADIGGGRAVDFASMTVRWADGTQSAIHRLGPNRAPEPDQVSLIATTPPPTNAAMGKPPPTTTDAAVPSNQKLTVADAEKAVRSDDLTVLWRYVDQGGDPDATVSVGGCTLLYITCRIGRLTAARYLVEVAGADVNLASGQAQSTPLHGACYGGHPDVVEMLVRNGADIKKKNNHGHTPQNDADSYAAQGGKLEIAQRCSCALATPSPAVRAPSPPIDPSKPSAVFHSIPQPPAQAMPVLTSTAPTTEPNTQFPAKETISKDVVVDPGGWRAAINHKGADVDLRLGYAQYLVDVAQEMAAATAQLEIAVALDPTRDDAREVLAMTLKEGGQHAAALCVFHTTAALAQAPHPPHADATALLVRETLVLHFAAVRLTSPHDAFAALDQYLAAYAGDPNTLVPTEDGHTLLYLAACSGHVALVLRLVKEPRTVVSKRSGPSRSTALHGACANGHEDTVRLLLSCGADTGACNKDKATPRQLAHAKQHMRCVALLDAITNGTLPLAAAVPVVLGSPKSAPTPMPAVAKRVDTFAQLRGVAAGTNPPPVFTRRIRDRELTVQYLCTACRDKQTGKPTKCPTFADFYRHVTGPKCVATGLQGSYRLLHMDTTQPKAPGGGGSAAAAPTATPLKAFTNDRENNVVLLYNAMCALLDNDTLCRSHGNTVVSCLLDKFEG